MNAKLVVVFGVIFALLLLGSNAFYVVNETQRGVLLEFQKVKNADLKPGLGFKMPMINNIITFDGRVQVLDSPAEEFLTLEKKRLIVDSYVTWVIADVQKYYTTTGGLSRNASQLLADRVNNGLRDKFGRRTVHEVISGEREQLMVELTKEVNAFSEDAYGIKIVDIRVKQINLPTSASEAVYARMRAERNREAQEYRSTGKELAEGIQADADRQGDAAEYHFPRHGGIGSVRDRTEGHAYGEPLGEVVQRDRSRVHNTKRVEEIGETKIVHRGTRAGPLYVGERSTLHHLAGCHRVKIKVIRDERV